MAEVHLNLKSFALNTSLPARVTSSLKNSEICLAHYSLNCINCVYFVNDDVTYLYVAHECRCFVGDSKATAPLSHTWSFCVSVKSFSNLNRVNSTKKEFPNYLWNSANKY